MAKKITVNINLAIAHYNENRPSGKPEMTTQSLADKLFKDDRRMKSASKLQVVSSWNSGGDNISRCQPKHIQMILKETGIDIFTLIPAFKS